MSNEAFRKDLVNLADHGKDISQMIWGSIWLGGLWIGMNLLLEGVIQLGHTYSALRRILSQSTSREISFSKIIQGFMSLKTLRSGLNLMGFGLWNGLHIPRI
jgi:hypothetical protein